MNIDLQKALLAQSVEANIREQSYSLSAHPFIAFKIVVQDKDNIAGSLFDQPCTYESAVFATGDLTTDLATARQQAVALAVEDAYGKLLA